MAEDDQKKQPEISQMFVQMSEIWREQMEKATAAGTSWSESMMPFLTARAADNGLFGAAQGGSISEAIKRMADGPRLADIASLDKQMYEVIAAWTEVQQRMAAYHAVVSVPWNRAFNRYSDSLKDSTAEEAKNEDWRKQFNAWSSIANEELIKNQRSDAFLTAQRDLLRSTLDLRQKQQSIADQMAKLFGLPTQQDFDDLNRQLTEVRRELRTFLRSQRREAANKSQPQGEDAAPAPAERRAKKGAA